MVTILMTREAAVTTMHALNDALEHVADEVCFTDEQEQERRSKQDMLLEAHRMVTEAVVREEER